MRLLPRDSEHGWTPYLWLIYIGPYVVFPFLFPQVAIMGSRALTLTTWAAGLAAFLMLYFRSHWVDGAPRLKFVIALAALGAVLGPRNPGALMFFIYAAGFVGGAARPSRAGIWIGAITVAGILMALQSPWDPYLLVSGIAVMAPLIGFVNLHYSETRRRDAALKLAQEEIARVAVIAERERIAADLHDLLGQTLSVIVLKSELAAKLIDRDSVRAGQEMREVERVSRDALAEVRRAVRGFRNANLADEVLRARAVLETGGVRVLVDAPSLNGPNEPSAVKGTANAVEHAAAMILREAVTNVVRHARATHCRITARRDANSFLMRIEDDGVGGRITEGAGIEGMRARAREIGGSLDYHPADARSGLAVTLRVPLSPPE